MDENTVFQKEESIITSSDPKSGSIQPGGPEVGQPPPPPSIVSPTDLDLEDDGPNFLSTAIKIGVGIVVILAIAFLVWRFILPQFSKQKSEKVTLTYWGLWEDKNTMQSVILDFQRKHPNITVNYSKEDIKQYRERLQKRTELGTGPDILRLHNTWVPMLSEILLPLPNDIIKASEFKKTYYPVAADDLIKNGAIYGIPFGTDTLSLFVNTEILKSAGQKVPETWDDFIKVARALTVKDETGRIKTAGASLGTFDNINHAPDIVSLLLVQNGANLKDLSKNPQAASDALNFYTSFAKGEGNVWDTTLDPSIIAFSKGSLAMYFGYSWDIFSIKAANPTLTFEVYSVPHLPGRSMTIASYWADGVSAKSKHQKEAYLFLKFLSEKETAQKLYSEASKTRLFGAPYARLDLGESIKDNKLVYPFVAQTKNAVSTFFVSDTFDDGLNSESNAYLGNAVRSVLDNTSSESAVDTLSKGVSQVLQKYSVQ